MSKLFKDIDASRLLIRNLQQLVQMNCIKQQNNRDFQNLISQLTKSQKIRKDQATQALGRTNKIKKNKKTCKKKTNKNLDYSVELQSDKQFLEYLRCDEQFDESDLCFTVTQKIGKQIQQNQKEMLQDCLTDLVEQICYENQRRKSLLQIQAKDFLKILLRIQNQYEKFFKRINLLNFSFKLDLSEKKKRQQQLERQFVNGIQLYVPEIKEVLQNFEDKYNSSPEYKQEYRQLLSRKRIIYSIKRNIDRQNQSDEDQYCSNFQLISKTQQQFHAEDIYSTLNSQNIRKYTEIRNRHDCNIFVSSLDWSDLKQLRKVQEQVSDKDQKKKKKKQKKKNRIQGSRQSQILELNDRKVQEIGEYLQNLQLDSCKMTDCRLDQQFMEKFKQRNLKRNKSPSKTKFKFNESIAQSIFNLK